MLPRAQGLCDTVTGFSTTGKEVWLTIDDGPDPVDTPQILEMLDTYGAKATFFMIGERASSHPELVRQVVERGHSVGNHTFSHPLKDFWCAGPGRVRRELKLTQDTLRRAGADTRLFRAPAGIKNLFLRSLLPSYGLRNVAWTIRSGDALGSNSGKIINRVLREARPGSIILMHEGESMRKSVRVESLRAVLHGLTKDGYSFVVPPEHALRYS
jgi:peptidoglycan/xylan/chitin deacetylase (PgdA/CDA1 family)